ncbi:RNA polymerase sigma factor [Sorangium sp. So ce1389]|uniref:RNA polymerase sigma factor n=1 Tax=Sorangium sp. So ce1389 TaxID=3133336 RepID=UPI003F61F6E1
MELLPLPPRGAIVHCVGTCIFTEASAPVGRHAGTARPSASGAPHVAAHSTARLASLQSALKPAADRDRAQSFHHLFQAETVRRVHRWLGKLGVPERDRSDLSQDVFLAAVTSFGSYDPSRGSVSRWLNGIAVNLASHYHEKASQRYEVITDPAELCKAGGSATAIDLLLAVERRRLLKTLVLGLPFELRSVLVQHDVHEISMREIAETRAIPASTVYRWRTKALRAAREALAMRLAAEEERCASPGRGTGTGCRQASRQRSRNRARLPAGS